MAIPSDLASRFPRTIRARGEEYYRSGVVALEQVSATMIGAIVKGTGLYQVSIGRKEDGSFTLYCTCPYAAGDVYCKHVWATLLEADATNRLPLVSAVTDQRLEHRPVEHAPDEHGPDEFEDESAENDRPPEVMSGQSGFPSRVRSPEWNAPPGQAQSKAPPWKVQLRGVQAFYPASTARTSPKPWPADRRIVYVVDASSSAWGGDDLHVDVATQVLQRDQSWSAPKQMRQSRAQWLAAPDPEDRLIAHMLLGSRAQYSYYEASAPKHFVIAPDSIEITLRRMCDTGR